ncbi:MAG: hypothetical protein QM652_01275 [Legionella sp.]|uniref:hypothetical protein n=1 Tax=Legionella sp. TaxID=459 RepID=UPI0039E22A31
MKIENLDDAHQAWNRLQKKYEHLANSLFKDKPLNKEKVQPADLENKHQAYELAAKKIQRYYRQFNEEHHYYTKVNPKGSHSSLFLYFLNPQKEKKVNKLIEPTLQKQLLEKLEKGDLKNIPSYKYTLAVALALYDSNKISMQQFFTILERYQLCEIHRILPIENTYPILDAHGQFTQEAKNYLLPHFTQDHTRRSPRDFINRQLKTKEDMEAFRLLLLKLPKSEQTFNLIKGEGFKQLNSLDININEGRLAFELAKRQTISHDPDTHQVIHLSFGARDALGMAEYGDHYAPIFPRLNEQSINDIEHGVRHGIRPSAMFFPHTIPYKNIHDYEAMTNFEATEHDYYHAQGLSSLDPEVRKALLFTVDSLRSYINSKWSKEIWLLIDADFLHLKDKDKNTQFYDIVEFVFNCQKTLTIAGIILLNDFLNNKKWEEINLPIVAMSSTLSGESFPFIESVLKGEDDLMIKIVKCHILSTFKDSLSEKEMEAIVQTNYLNPQKLTLGKSKSSENKNAVIIQMNGQELNLTEIKDNILRNIEMSSTLRS